MIAFIPELSVRIVLEDRHAVLIGQSNERLSPLERKGDASRVLKIRAARR